MATEGAGDFGTSFDGSHVDPILAASDAQQRLAFCETTGWDGSTGASGTLTRPPLLHTAVVTQRAGGGTVLQPSRTCTMGSIAVSISVQVAGQAWISPGFSGSS